MDCCKLLHFFLFFTPSLLFIKSSISAATLAPNETLLDDGTTLVSENGSFELGYFSPANSSRRYVGIWFKKVTEQTIVWVANRNTPITDSTGSLSITASGIIVISNNRSGVVWTANSSAGAVENPILKLLDNGNLILKTVAAADDDPGSYLWQSFDSPLDTLIPGMKLGWDLRKNQEWYLTSWRSTQDPSPGDYTYRMDPTGLPSSILRQGSEIKFRSGPWDGERFSGAPIPLRKNGVFNPIFVYNSTDVYYAFENNDVSIISRFVVNYLGQTNHFIWSQTSNQWLSIPSVVTDLCDSYSRCGNFGICEVNKSPICSCLRGFEPQQGEEWSQLDWRGGCVRRTPLNCSKPTGFRKLSSVKVPDTSDSAVNTTAMNREKCEKACFRNCSCLAYAMTQTSECVLWFGEYLTDIRVYAKGGMDLFVRMPSSELDLGAKSKKVAPIIASVVGVLALFLVLVVCQIIRKRTAKKKIGHPTDNPSQVSYNPRGEDEDLDLPLFDFPAISSATGEFALANKIGEGGFGGVYKGVLSDGKEIAVKRLSKNSGQGLPEFKNEVILISKLQHRNLVRLLGCCIHGDERMLVYEYMKNRSLDLFIFCRHNNKPLHWKTRFDIIIGIARGILYLHRDSRLRIIHRDLKASNILLDNEMNPKISDFGLARSFKGEQYQDSTKRIMGTYGYMSPEYAVDGLFSVKSDVFSFGVLVLEIVSGTRNRGFYHPDHHLNLLGHAWKLWNEGNPTELLDSSLGIPCIEESEVVRCIQVGLLCVQQHPEDRPTMSDALLMLDSEHPVIAQPKQPGFYTERDVVDTQSFSPDKRPHVSNEVTVSLLQGR